MRYALAATLIFLSVTPAFAESPKSLAATDQTVLGRFPSRQQLEESARFPDFRGRDRRFNQYRTRISNGVAGGVNFAGAYSLVEIGCGTSCMFAYLVDLRSGQVFDFPLGGDNNQGLQLYFKSNSEAVVAYWQSEGRCIRQTLYWAFGRFELLQPRIIGSDDACYDRATGTEQIAATPAPTSTPSAPSVRLDVPADPEKRWSPQFRIGQTAPGAPSSDLGAQRAQHDPPNPPANPLASSANRQAQFLSAITSARNVYDSGNNDMAKGAARPMRARELCAAFSSPLIVNWTGKIATLSSNSDGYGVLGVDIGDGAVFRTWNNSLSDISDQTLISPDSVLFKQAVSLSVGQPVRFSGTLIPGQSDCFREGSLSLSGSIKSPEFIFRFSEIAPN